MPVYTIPTRLPDGPSARSKATSRIVRRNAVGKVRPPRPKHEIVHVCAGSVCKGWHQYACCGPAKAVRDPPRGGLTGVVQIQPPRAGHISKLDLGSAAGGIGSEINDIGHINIILDDRERLHSVRKATCHFDHHVSIVAAR